MNEYGDFSMQRLVNRIGRGPWIRKLNLIGENRLYEGENAQ
jgi:hypothetical protein